MSHWPAKRIFAHHGRDGRGRRPPSPSARGSCRWATTTPLEAWIDEVFAEHPGRGRALRRRREEAPGRAGGPGDEEVRRTRRPAPGQHSWSAARPALAKPAAPVLPATCRAGESAPRVRPAARRGHAEVPVRLARQHVLAPPRSAARRTRFASRSCASPDGSRRERFRRVHADEQVHHVVERAAEVRARPRRPAGPSAAARTSSWKIALPRFHVRDAAPSRGRSADSWAC